jgi:hypothetical protein
MTGYWVVHPTILLLAPVAADTEPVPFWKLLVLEILFGVSETLCCSVSAFQEIIALLLGALDLGMLFALTLINLILKMILFMVFYDHTFSLNILLYLV